ncbi:MAG: hypothetical protein U0637_08875 [Phycisphaerales bacterium]
MRKVLSVVAIAAFAGLAQAQDMSQVNGYSAEIRRFNDFGGSSLLVNGVNEPAPTTHPLAYGPVHFQENFAQGEPGNFANKHIAWLSADGGANKARTNVGQSWSIDFDVNMNSASGAPRKEAGIEIWQPRGSYASPDFIDEGQVLIASDNGEVAVFGASLPFTGFGTGCYTLGTTAHVSFRYFAPGVQDPTKGAYQLVFTDAVTGVHDSGIKVWGAEYDNVSGMRGAYVGLKDQNQRNPFIADSVDVLYSGVSIVPAPAALGLLGLAGLSAARRRR